MTIMTVIVLYRPDDDTLAFIEAYATVANPVVAVWNEFIAKNDEPFRNSPNITVIRNPDNVGLAKALNIGIVKAFEAGAESVFLLDQDSRPCADVPHELLEARNQAIAAGINVGLIGPTLCDRKSAGVVNAVHDVNEVHQIVPRLSTSGSLIDKAIFYTVGPMWDALFIDSIDHEWCYRAQSHGLAIVQSCTIKMEHNMGDAGVNFLGRYKPIHRSPARHYYIIRNIFWLLRLPYVPKTFSLLEVAKMTYRLPIYIAVSMSRIQTINSIIKGARDGILQKIIKPEDC